ncbi:MBL fold metallo-hydrolase [soil metagenome]
MRLTHYGHACVLIETDDARLLFDPGTLSTGFEALRDLTAFLVSHEHPDHLDAARIAALMTANPDATVYCEAGCVDDLADSNPVVANGGERLEFGSTLVEVHGGQHADIFEGFPGSGNLAFLVDGGRYLHPGDAFPIPDAKVDVLGLPIAAPWLKLADAIAYVRAVGPRVAVPIHQGDLKDTATSYFMVGHFTPEGTDFHPVEQGVTTDL